MNSMSSEYIDRCCTNGEDLSKEYKTKSPYIAGTKHIYTADNKIIMFSAHAYEEYQYVPISMPNFTRLTHAVQAKVLILCLINMRSYKEFGIKLNLIS